MVRQCDENAHEAWKYLIGKYEISDEKKESFNEVTNRWNTCGIKDTSQHNELFNLNLKLNKIKEKYEKYEDDLKSHVLDVLTED